MLLFAAPKDVCTLTNIKIGIYEFLSVVFLLETCGSSNARVLVVWIQQNSTLSSAPSAAPPAHKKVEMLISNVVFG